MQNATSYGTHNNNQQISAGTTVEQNRPGFAGNSANSHPIENNLSASHVQGNLSFLRQSILLLLTRHTRLSVMASQKCIQTEHSIHTFIYYILAEFCDWTIRCKEL